MPLKSFYGSDGYLMTYELLTPLPLLFVATIRVLLRLLVMMIFTNTQNILSSIVILCNMILLQTPFA